VSRRWSSLLVVIGLALLVGVPLLWLQSQPALTVGETPPAASQPDRDTPSTLEPPAATASPEDAAPAADEPGDGDEPSATEEPAPAGSEPRTLELPTLDVRAEVDPVALEDDRGMELPDDVSRVGWYAPGVPVGAPGAAVLAGHVDSRTQGPGALFDLRSLEPGDPIVITAEDGTSTWEVTGRTHYPKDELPLDDIFRWEGEPGLVLITCGGDFDGDAGSYRDNVVVYAEPT
jgi:hypothetical protein